MAKTPNYNWTTYEDGVTVINFQTDISNFIKDVDTKLKSIETNLGLSYNPNEVNSEETTLEGALEDLFQRGFFLHGRDVALRMAYGTYAIGVRCFRYDQTLYLILQHSTFFKSAIRTSSGSWVVS